MRRTPLSPAGRNGGHVAPWSFYNFARIIRPYALGGGDVSDEEGLNVLQLERDNLAYVADTVEREGWAVDFWKGEKIEGESGGAGYAVSERCPTTGRLGMTRPSADHSIRVGQANGVHARGIRDMARGTRQE